MAIIGLSMTALACCAEGEVEAGSAALRVDWPVYPRRAEHNTVAEGGNRRWAETARRPVGLVELADDPENVVRPAQQDRQRRVMQPRQWWAEGRMRHAVFLLCGFGSPHCASFRSLGTPSMEVDARDRAMTLCVTGLSE
jgi:hypothetical protein